MTSNCQDDYSDWPPPEVLEKIRRAFEIMRENGVVVQDPEEFIERLVRESEGGYGE